MFSLQFIHAPQQTFLEWKAFTRGLQCWDWIFHEKSHTNCSLKGFNNYRWKVSGTHFFFFNTHNIYNSPNQYSYNWFYQWEPKPSSVHYTTLTLVSLGSSSRVSVLHFPPLSDWRSFKYMRPCGKQTFTCEPVETITATKIIDITKNLANNRLCTCSRICYHLSTNQNTCVELKNWVIIAFASVTSTFNLILYTCMLRGVSLTGVETFALWYHWKYKINMNTVW